MDTVWLTLALPLLGALVCATHYRVLGRAATGTVASLAILGAFCASLHQAYLVTRGGEFTSKLANWLVLPGISGLDFAALVDPLCVTMLCTVTGVAFLIHCYSMGYMADEEDYGRFFASLNLFVATMVCLVIANNLGLLLIGWGGVGFASYNLIGFYRYKPSAVSAARKAFLINVVGDVGLMLGIFLIANRIGALDYKTFLQQGELAKLGPDVMVAGALLLVAAYAKSAQMPFHTWLPDAMEGPTPVSALIHAATMVTAGVYLVARCNPLFSFHDRTIEHAAGAAAQHGAVGSDLMAIVAMLGAATALFAALCAIVQNDLKRILAYSTMSQLGYMFLACGVGAYSAAVFHLVTHAFFKALLFLTAGVVIHALHGEQDITRMGALGRRLPGAQFAFLLGSLALAGIPPLAGFWSKEAILASTFPFVSVFHEGPGMTEGNILWGVGIVTALLTAYYSFRAYWLVFWAPAHHEHQHLHLPGSSMGWPLALLSLLTLAAGFAGERFMDFLALQPPAQHHGFGALEMTAVGVAVAGVLIGWFLHRSGRATLVAPSAQTFFRGPEAVDGLSLVLARWFRRLADAFATRVDPVPSQLAPDLVRRSLLGGSSLLCQLQGGSLRLYALAILASAALLASFVFVLAIFVQGGPAQ
jgi:NADH-quinone oxidoreductase subunit L